MLFRVSVVVNFVLRGLGISRSKDVDVEATTPLTREIINSTVDDLIKGMIPIIGTHESIDPGELQDYSFEIESVFRDLGGETQ